MTRIVRSTLLVSLLALAAEAQAQNTAQKWTVSPGQSIQEAIDKAAMGDIVQVLPGEYVESITIAKDRLVVVGMEYEGERATLRAKDAEENEPLERAIVVRANEATVQGFAIEGFSKVGVEIQPDGFRELMLQDLFIQNCALGVSVDGVDNVTLDRVVSGSARIAAISITRSSDVRLLNCEGYRSGIGLGMEGTQQVTVDNCAFHANAVGVLLMATSKDDGKATSYTKVFRSRIMGNNSVSAALDPALPYRFPSGIGILIWGADHTEIAQSIVTDNATLGIATLAFDKNGARHLAADGARSGPPADLTYVHHNRYANNGATPSAEFTKAFAEIPAGDLYWDGLGEKNQWQESTELKTYPEKLVVKQGGVHTDVIHFQ